MTVVKMNRQSLEILQKVVDSFYDALAKKFKRLPLFPVVVGLIFGSVPGIESKPRASLINPSNGYKKQVFPFTAHSEVI